MGVDQKSSLDQQYKALVVRFKQLHNGQDVLAKLGHVTAGSTTIESKIFAALKSLKPLIGSGDPLIINAQISAANTHLKEYDDWLAQCNNTLTPYGLRQYILQGQLKHEDL